MDRCRGVVAVVGVLERAKKGSFHASPLALSAKQKGLVIGWGNDTLAYIDIGSGLEMEREFTTDMTRKSRRRVC